MLMQIFVTDNLLLSIYTVYYNYETMELCSLLRLLLDTLIVDERKLAGGALELS